jgi:3-hydroxyacyl-[acyl-carrier-protein] dehydratase
MEDFDAPEEMRRRFALLCDSGAPGGQFEGVPQHDIEMVELIPGAGARALLRVPREAAFFLDHFPRRPVFPGTMLLDAEIQVSLQAAAGWAHWPKGARIAATGVPDMKIRAFIPPGEVVELRVELSPPTGGGIMVAKTSAHANGKRIAMGGLEIEARRS